MHLFVVIVLSIIASTGCASRSVTGSWRLQPRVLVPPQPPVIRQDRQVIKLRSLRGCTYNSPEVTLARNGTLSINAALLAPPTEVRLTGPQSVTGIPVQDFAWFVRFTRHLETCSGMPNPAAPILDQLSLNTRTDYDLRFGDFGQNGYLDLDSTFRLRTITPRAGTWDTAYFTIKDRPGGGVTITPPVIAAAPNMRYYRMFFRTWNISSDRKIALLAAPTQVALDTAAKSFEAAPETFCSHPEPAACLSIPVNASLGAETLITVNGAPSAVGLKGNVGEVLRNAQVKDSTAVLKTLRITRPFRGRQVPVEFDRTRPDVLNLLLIGGEQISW